jgi:hypothetical protein
MILQEQHKKLRWTAADKEWLLETVKYLELDGYPKVAKMLKEEIDKI